MDFSSGNSHLPQKLKALEVNPPVSRANFQISRCHSKSLHLFIAWWTLVEPEGRTVRVDACPGRVTLVENLKTSTKTTKLEEIIWTTNLWGQVNGTWCSGQGANGRFFSHDANSMTQRPSKGTCDTGTSSCRCRKPITTLLATVCIDTGSLRDRRCEMPRWWWICWTGLFCEESQWKHRISVRLKLSKLQFGIWFAMSLF